MKLYSIFLLSSPVGTALAFAPNGAFTRPTTTTKTSPTMRNMAIDPSIFTDLHQHVMTSASASSIHIAAIDPTPLLDAATQNADAVATTAAAAATSSGMVPVDQVGEAAVDAAAAADSGNGWFGFLTGPIQGLLFIIHSVLVSMGMSENAWGLSILAMTATIKALTFPITKTQLESTNKMQALQPAIKDVQAKYQSNPEVMNQKIAALYQENGVNPLAGCIPSLVQIPIFIGLYRAVLTLAKENRLDEPFLWLPNLEGPTYGADPTHGSDWILKNWIDGAPSMGWADTLAFLSLPAFLVVSQFVSMQLMQPKNQDPQQQQANVILKFLPLMIGWFSLNVPAALCIYWVANNIITTATTVLVRSSMSVPEPIVDGSGSAGASTMLPPTSAFTPPPVREKPSGFASSGGGGGGVSMDASSSSIADTGGVKPLTPMDAEIVSKDSSETTGGDAGEGEDGFDKPPPKPKGKKRGKKKRRN